MSQTAKQKFADAFEHLLNNHQLSRITVTQLAKECGLSRRCFYNNFIDIYDFVFSIHIMKFQYITDSFLENKKLYDALLSSLYTIKKYNSFYKELINTQGPNSFIKNLIPFMVDNGIKIINQPVTDDLLFCLELYWTGFSYKLCEWIENDMNIAPEDFVLLFEQAMPEKIKPYYYNNNI